MPIPLYYGQNLINAVRSGVVPETVINAKVSHVLSSIVRAGLLGPDRAKVVFFLCVFPSLFD